MSMSSYNDVIRKKRKQKFVVPSSDQILSWVIKHFDYKDGDEQVRICNPDGDTNFCMTISKSKAVVHDFRPNHQQYDGSFIKFVSAYKNISIREAINEICGDNIILSKQQEEVDEKIENEIELPQGSKSLRENDNSMIRKLSMGYLINERGFDEKTIFKYNIHYCGTNIVVPYYQFDSLVFYQSRQVLSKEFRFPNAGDAGDYLFGFDNVEPCTDLIIVESAFNAMSVGNNCVSTGGASVKPNQIKLIKILNPSRIILAPDNDAAGVKSLEKDFHSLNKLFSNIYYSLSIFNKDKKIDWNDMLKMNMNVKKYIYDNMKKLNHKELFDGIKQELFH